MDKLHTYHFSASALSYILVIIALITALMASFILIHSGRQKVSNGLILQHLDEVNMASGFGFARALVHRDGLTSTDTVLPLNDRAIEVKIAPWGLFGLAKIKVEKKESTCALFGSTSHLPGNFILDFLEEDKEIKVCDAALLKGKIGFPKTRLRPWRDINCDFRLASIKNVYEHGNTQHRKPKIPASVSILFDIERGQNITLSDSLTVPFSSVIKTIAADTINVQGAVLHGHIRLQGRVVHIKQSQLQNVVIVADQIHLDSVAGSAQLLARDKIVQHHSVLSFPSVLAIMPRDSLIGSAYILLGHNSSVQGDIIIYPGKYRSTLFHLIDTAELVGQAVIYGTTQVDGTIRGRLLTKTLQSSVSGKIVHNLINQGRVLSDDRMKWMTTPVTYEDKEHINIAAWVN